MIYRKEVERWKQLFLKAVEPCCNLPILLSGGLDSGTILAACLELGGRPTVYTFHLENNVSTDARVALLMADRYGLECQVVVIPRDVSRLVSDIRKIIRFFGRTGKALVQCAHPMMYLAEMVRKDGHNRVLVGTGGIIEDNRKCAVILNREGESAARRYRAQTLVPYGSEGSATRGMHEMLWHGGIETAEPFTENPFRDYALSLDMAVLNYPKLKGIAVRAFPQFWLKNGWYRKNSPMQVNGGLREFHDVLLSTEYNQRNSRSVIGVYNDLAREVGVLASNNG